MAERETFTIRVGQDLVVDGFKSSTLLRFEGPGLSLASLTVTQVGSDTLITFANSNTRVRLTNFEAPSLLGGSGSYANAFQFSATFSSDAGATGTSGNDMFSGGAGNDALSGGNGNDSISGGAGNDTISGGGGNDTLGGGVGNDVLNGGTGSDLLDGGEGDDTLVASADATFTNGWSAFNAGTPGAAGTGETVSIQGQVRSYDVFEGGEGFDRISLSGGNDALFLDDGYSPQPTPGGRIRGIEAIDAGDGNDVVDLTSTRYAVGDVIVDGGAGNDILWTSAGNDSVLGGAGNDRIWTGVGNDTISGGSGSDTIDGSAGIDTAVFTSSYVGYRLTGIPSNFEIVDIDPTNGDTGTDRIQNVEFLDFNGTIVSTQWAINVAPSAANTTIGGPEDVTLSGRLAGIDLNGDTLVFAPVTGPANGTLTINADGSYSYAPTANWSGTDAFSYQVSDGRGGTATGQVTVNVAPVADQPSLTVSLGTPVVNMGTSSVSMTGYSGSAGYNSSYGIYTIGADGLPSTGQIVWANVKNHVGETATVSGVDPTKVGFFVIPDGASNNGSKITDGESVRFEKNAQGQWTVVDSQGNRFSGDGANVLFDKPALNAGNYAQLQDNAGNTGDQNWEDLAGGGDRDFNDLNVATAWTSNNNGRATIPLNIATGTPDADGSERLSIQVSGLPTGSILKDASGATLVPNSNGVYALTTAQLPGLTVTTPAGYSGPITANVVSVSTDGTSIASASASGNVSVDVANDAPVAPGGSVVGAVNAPITGQLAGTDADGDKLTFSIAQNGAPAHGSVTINPDGTYNYVPANGYNGNDSFTYRIVDGRGGVTTGTITVGVGNVNTAPVAQNGAAQGAEDNTVTGTAVATDANGDALAFTVLASGAPQHGAVTMNANGTYSYVPNADFNGTDSFTYKVADGRGGFSTATVTITVDPVNDRPVATATSVAGNEDGSVTGAVTASDIDGDALTFSVPADGGPANGTVTMNADGTFTYAPNPDFNGTDTFTYQVSDGQGGTTTAQISVNVAAVNDAPTTGVATASGSEDSAISGQIVANDVDGDTLSYAVPANGGPANGTVAMNADGSYTYTPGANFNGTDSFSYTVADGKGGTATGTVQVSVASVNDGPTTSGGAASVDEDTTITGQLVGADIDGDALTFSVPAAGAPQHGTVAVAADGSYTYTPNANFNGTDSFTYTVSDGKGGTTTGTIAIDVASVNDGPTTDGGTASGSEDAPITGQLAGADIDGDGLTFSVPVSGAPQNGSVTVAADGSYTYTPNANFNGTDSFTYTVSDGKGGTTTGTIAIDVASVNDGPTTSGGAAAGNEDAPITGQLVGADVDGDGLTFSVPFSGAPQNGSVTVAADGSYTYTPNANFNGTDSFTYTVSDGKGGTTTGTINIDVAAVNDGPTTAGGTASGSEDAPITGQLAGSDVDGDTLTFSVPASGAPQNGSVTVAADGSYTYTPNANFNGTDSFTYTVSDGKGGTTTGTIAIDVAAVNDGPTTAGGAASGSEDAPITGQLAGSDIDGDALTFSVPVSGAPQNGSVTVAADGSYTYTPNANFNGTDSFTYTVSDGKGGTTTGTINIDVASVNDGPTTTGGSASGDEDTTVTGQIAAADVDGDALSFALAADGAPANGTVTVNPDGSYSYVPAANFNGTDSFTYTVSDGNGGTTTGTISVAVGAVNDGPVTAGGAATGSEDNTVSGQLLATDVDGDALAFTVPVSGAPQHGSVTVAPDGSYTYTPEADFNGTDSFTYTVSDGKGGTATGTISIDVGAVNDGPVTSGASVSGNEDTAIAGALSASDVDGDALAFAAGDGPAHGSVTVNADGTFVYVPGPNYNGTDSFTYTVSDGNGGTATGTVDIGVASVNDGPVAMDATATGSEDAPLAGQLAASDVDGDALTFGLATGPQNGAVTVNADGSFTYVPAANFNGTDTFVYSVSDGQGGTTTAQITVGIASVNDNPITAGGQASGAEDTAIVGMLAASDVDGDALDFALASGPQNGTVTVNADGSYSFVPDADFNGTDSFTYTVSDGQGGTATGTVDVSVGAVNDGPTTTNGSATGTEDVTVTGQIVASDIDGDTLSYSVPANGGPANGTVAIAADGSYTYTPNANFNGTDSFTYTVSDGKGGTATGTISVAVGAVNDGPTTTNGSATGTEDGTVTGQIVASDIDGDTLSYSVPANGGPANGTVAIAADGSYTYTPNANFNGTDSFTYTVSDGKGGTTTGTISVAVGAVNDGPTTTNGSATGTEDGTVTGQIVASDIDGDTLSYAIPANGGPANGTVSIAADGSYTYTPKANFNGTDSFTYTVSDGKGGTTTGTISVAVGAVNDGPSTTNGSATGTEDGTVTGQIVASDIDGDTLSYAIPANGGPANGTVAIAADGSYTYTPNANFNGTDSFTYIVSDGKGGTTTGTIDIDVAAVNDLPQTAGGTAEGSEDNAVAGQLAATDADGDALSYAVAPDGEPANGTVTLNLDGSYTYTPNADFNGSDSFTYTVSDGKGGFATGTVEVEIGAVNDGPTTPGGSSTGNEDGTIAGQIVASDVDGDALDFGLAANGGPANGTVSIAPDGSYTYTPNANFNGTDSFTYTVSDGKGGTTTGTIALEVASVNDGPTTTSGSATGTEDGIVTGQIAASDVDGDTLSYAVPANGGPANGTVSIAPDGSYTYTPNANFNGTDTFTYTVSDGNGGTATGTISVVVGGTNDGPTTSDATASGNEDGTVMGQIVASDIDGDVLSYAIPANGGPANGTVSIAPDGSYTYTPNANFNGTDSFTYTVSDGKGGTATGTISVSVGAVNDGPTTAGGTADGMEDGTVTGQLVASDIEGDALTFGLAANGGPANGTVSIAPDGSYTYTPAADFNGTDSFTYTVSDGNGGTTTGTISVSVGAVNDTPVGVDAADAGDEDTAIAGQLAATDADGDALAYSLENGPAHGTVTLNLDGSYTYTPDADYFGADSFTYTVSDGKGGFATGSVDLSVASVNDTPVPADEAAATVEETAIAGQLSATDADGDSLSYALADNGGPAHGTVTLNLDGSYTYMPAADFSGTDSFTYTVSDGKGGFATGTVALSVAGINDGPVAVAGTASGDEDTAIVGQLVASDADGDTLSFTVAPNGAPAHGSVVIGLDGTYTYTPGANYFGSDTFSYTVSDGNGGTSTATITVGIASVNDAPSGETATIQAGEDSVTTGQLAVTDVDGDTLAYALVPGQGPAHGTLTLQPDGSFTYTPAANFVGADSFSYTVTDGKSPPVTVVQQIGVTNLNDPPVAAVAAYLSRQDVPLTGQLVASDIDGDALTFSVANNGGPSNGDLQINPDGTFVYTPGFNYMGPETFTFSVSDGRGGTASATVAILINETNDAPGAQATQFALAEDTVLAGNIQARDVEGDQFTVSLADGQGPQHGVVTVEPDGRFVYTPDANYNGPDSFVVRMLDQYGAASTQTITLAVAPVHDTPTAANLVAATLEDTPLNMPWATINPDGTSLQYRVVSAPALGTFTINGEAGFTYVSGPDISGQDHVVYEVSNDGFRTWTSGTIDIGIAPVNDAPRPLIDTFFTVEDQWVRIVLEAYDIEGDAVANFAIVGNPAHGTLTDLGSGQYGYVPDSDWYGTDTFRYSITDEHGASAEYTATVGISPIGNEPVVQSVEYTGLQDQYVYGTVPMYDPDTPLWQYYLLDPVVTQGQGGGLFELINTNTGEFVFRPTLHWSGTFQVELRAVDRDGNVSEQPAYITITLEAVNYAPSVVGDYALGTNGYSPMNTPLSGNLAALGSDIETAQADLVWSVAQQAAHGTVTIDANGDYVYTPNNGYTGWDSFQYQVTDANGVVSNAGTASVHMNLVALPTVWGDQPEFDAVRSGVPISGQISATDGNGPLQFYAIGDAANSGRLTLNVDGTFTYNPPITFSGQDSFMIQTFDPIDGTSSEKIYSFGVAANNGPTALDEHIAVEGGSAAAGQLDAFDPDGDALSFGMASGPAHGALQVAQDGTYVYVPANGFSGTDSFSYYVTDALGYSTTAIATIEIAPAPTVHDTSPGQVTVTMGAGVDVVMASAASDTPDVVVGFDQTEDRIDFTAVFGGTVPSDWAAHLTLENTAAGAYIGVDNAAPGAPEWSLLLANTTVNSLDDLLLTASQNQV